MSPRLSVCLASLDATTPVILQHVDCALAGTRFDAARDTVQIVLAEVLNNIVEHGYRQMPTGAVAVNLEGLDNVLLIDVTDWGQAYPDECLPDSIAPDPERMSEGGYGWFLIHALMTSVAYERRGSANRLTLSLVT